MNQLGILASGILQYDFDFIPSGVERDSELLIISGTLGGRIGELNNLIHQNFHFSGDSRDIEPPLQNEESAILRKIYMRDWAKKQEQKLIRLIFRFNIWIKLCNYHSRLDRAKRRRYHNKKKCASSATSAVSRMSTQKGFRELAKDIQEELKELVYRYNIYGSQPRQIISEDCPISVEPIISGSQIY